MAKWELQNMGAAELIEAYDRAQTDAGKGWIRDELLRRLSAVNPQAEKVRECEAPEHLSMGCRCAADCPCKGGEPERSDGRIQGGQAQHNCGVDPSEWAGPVGQEARRKCRACNPQVGLVQGEDACLLEWEAWRERNDVPETADTAWYAWSAAWERAEAQRSVGRIEAGNQFDETRPGRRVGG